MAETTPSGGFDDRAIERLAGLDKQIATLFTCTPLLESEVRKLCDQVGMKYTPISNRFFIP